MSGNPLQRLVYPQFARSPFDVAAVGASLGGVEVVGDLLAALPGAFPAAIVLVQHRASRPGREDLLAWVLQRRTDLRVAMAQDGEALRPGTVHVAPPGRRVWVRWNRTLAVETGSRVAFACPSVDVLMRSAAESCGPRALGVVMTGTLFDGAAGAAAIVAAGGRVLVQDPATARAPAMPLAALKGGGADFVLEPEGIAAALVALTMAPGAERLFRTGSAGRPHTG